MSVYSKLIVGDIFHASCEELPSLICLVTSISETTIKARTVTTQIQLEFDVFTGQGVAHSNEDIPCSIDSVEPLPVDIYNTVLGLDRKYRLGVKEDRYSLNEAEIEALNYIHENYVDIDGIAHNTIKKVEDEINNYPESKSS